MCAAAQDKFWQMHDALFVTQKRWETLAAPQATLIRSPRRRAWTSLLPHVRVGTLDEADDRGGHRSRDEGGRGIDADLPIGGMMVTGRSRSRSFGQRSTLRSRSRRSAERSERAVHDPRTAMGLTVSRSDDEPTIFDRAARTTGLAAFRASTASSDPRRLLVTRQWMTSVAGGPHRAGAFTRAAPRERALRSAERTNDVMIDAQTSVNGGRRSLANERSARQILSSAARTKARLQLCAGRGCGRAGARRKKSRCDLLAR